jgi:hypothetical protein
MATEAPSPVVFGRDGAPCSTCRAPLAGDQRYCLQCGNRRPQARLEFLDVLNVDAALARRASAAAELGAAAAPAPEPGLNGLLKANAGLVWLTGIVLVALAIGLLIGHWATQSPSRVVRVTAPQSTIGPKAAVPAPKAAAPTTKKAAPSPGAFKTFG